MYLKEGGKRGKRKGISMSEEEKGGKERMDMQELKKVEKKGRKDGRKDKRVEERKEGKK